jgi:putative peptidoglycan lipid II flippase
MMVTLGLAAWFSNAGYAAAWGVLISGILQALLVGGDAWRQGALPRFAAFRLDDDLRRFFRVLGPAVLGSAGTQIALLADTMIASLLPAGALSALYYADRLNQLPIGVIGIAVGTVLLPEMAGRLARGDESGARAAQDRAIELTLLLSLPCLVAFLMVPDLIMLALFGHGAFTAADARAAGATLAAYTVGLVPFVLARSFSATFLSRGDTATPVKALAVSVVVNVAFKILLMKPLAQVGLAFATSIGVWINVALLLWFALRARLIAFDERLKASTWKLLLAAAVLAIALWIGQLLLATMLEQLPRFRAETMLAALALIGAVTYIGAILLLFDRKWFAAFRGSAAPRPASLPRAE